MSFRSSSFVKKVCRFSLKDLANWLHDYLVGIDATPHVYVPSDYDNPALYLLDILGNENVEIGRRFGDATAELLKNSITTREVIPPHGNYFLLRNILMLLEGLPASDEEDVTDLLHHMRFPGRYKRWPSPELDCHLLILYALSNQLQMTTDSIKGWEESLCEEMNYLDYLVPAYFVLLQVNIEFAISRLCNVLGILKSEGVSPINFLFSFAQRLNDNERSWELVSAQLSLPEMIQYVDELAKILRGSGRHKIADEITRLAGCADLVNLLVASRNSLESSYIPDPLNAMATFQKQLKPQVLDSFLPPSLRIALIRSGHEPLSEVTMDALTYGQRRLDLLHESARLYLEESE
jgi:hypothetical protein